MTKKRGKGLSAEDRALWDKVAKSTTPMNRQRSSAPPKDTAPPPDSSTRADATWLPEPFRIGARAHGELADHGPASPKPAPLRMDRRTFQRMKRGKSKPDARIDLHGMTVAVAHPALLSFVLKSHAAGHRLLLVITGKGRGGDNGDPVPVRRGILRQQVPQWLTTPPLASVVLQIEPAHDRHGGSGAFYVYLRRR